MNWIVLFLLLLHPIRSINNTNPHIIYILADDLGWRYVDWHRTDLKNQSLTPNLHSLLKNGIELDRLYSFKYCSPSRSAIQTGRNPISVNVQNVVPEVSNSHDKIGGWQGIPTEMTGIATILQRANYSTNIVGKWDVGMATDKHHPRARGYDTWTGYWHHANDYWQHTVETCNGTAVYDLWQYNSTYDAPAFHLSNGKSCSQNNQTPPNNETCIYEEQLLTEHVIERIQQHDLTNTARPLFLFWSMHLVHMPLQVPTKYLDRFPNIENVQRKKMTAMVSYLDDDVGKVIDVLKTRKMYNNSLIIFHADNGGEIMGAGLCGGNNWGFNSMDDRGLRGGKFSNFEGGIRVNGMLSGGYLLKKMRGTRLDSLITVWDWYATLSAITGMDCTDHKAAKVGLPPHDSINQWALLSGRNTTAQRTEIIIGETSALSPNADGNTLVGGIIQGRMKLLLGAPDRLHTINQNVLTGPNWPNMTSHLVPLLHLKTCGRIPKHGCLYDVFDDPTESINLANKNASMQNLFFKLLKIIDTKQKDTKDFVYSPVRGPVDPRACSAVEKKYAGYWGPFV